MKLASLCFVTIAGLTCAFGCAGESSSTPKSQVAASANPAGPEFEALDENGVKFKLSDYRGKVVVLDFWGNW